ncbi:MAG: hypothetical protein ACKVQV_13495 [Bacteroidia bacterium]
MKIVSKMREITLIIIQMFILSSCSKTILEKRVAEQWRSDPNGCLQIRNEFLRHEILKIGWKLNYKNKLKLIDELGKPDKLILHRNKEYLLYYFRSNCQNGEIINDNTTGALQIIKDSTKIHIGFEDY